MLEAVSLHHLLNRPRYMGGAFLSTRLNWSREESVGLAALCSNRASLEKSAVGLGRSPTSIAHRARDTGLTLPPEWKDAITTYRRKLVQPKMPALQYPYIREVRGEHEIVIAVNALVPRGLPGELRADVCQELLMAVYEGQYSIEEMRASPKIVSQFITKMKRENYELSGFALSLDQPMRSGQSWYDVLPEPEPEEEHEPMVLHSFEDLGAVAYPEIGRAAGGNWKGQREKDAEARRRIASVGEYSAGLELDDDDLAESREGWHRRITAEPIKDTASQAAFRSERPMIYAPRPPAKRVKRNWMARQ